MTTSSNNKDFKPQLFLTLPSPEDQYGSIPFNSTPINYYLSPNQRRRRYQHHGYSKNESLDSSFGLLLPNKTPQDFLRYDENGDDDEVKFGNSFGSTSPRPLLAPPSSTPVIKNDYSSSGLIQLQVSSSIYLDGNSVSSSMGTSPAMAHSLSSTNIGASDHSFYQNHSLPGKYTSRGVYNSSPAADCSTLPPSPISCKSDTSVLARQMRRKISKKKGERETQWLSNRRLHSSWGEKLQRLHRRFEEGRHTQPRDLGGGRLRDDSDCDSKSELELVVEGLRKEKDNELNEVLKYKDEEVRQLKRLFDLEKDDSIRIALEIQQQEIHKRTELTYARMKKLKDEVRLLRSLNKTLEFHYREKCRDDNDKLQELQKIKDDFRAEYSRILTGNKLVSLRELNKMKRLEQSIFGENSSLFDNSFSENGRPPLVPSENENKNGVCLQDTPSSSRLKEVFDEDELLRPGSVNKRLFDEKEKPLQKKVGELQSQVLKLERKTTLLKTENESLKKKQEDSKCRDEKLKSLRKRNAELAGIARRLEEKAKILQQQNLKKTEVQDADHLKKLYQRQLSRENALHSKNLQKKEKEIEDLKKKYRELADGLGNMESHTPQNLQLYEEQEELVSIIKQAAKERLQLEKQLVKSKKFTSTKVSVSSDTNRETQQTNVLLDVQKDKLQETIKQLSDLEKSNQELQEEIGLLKKSTKINNFEKELQDSQSRSSKLEENVNVLENQVKQIETVTEECKNLKASLAQQEKECLQAKEQVSALEVKIISLETLIKDLQKSSSRLKTLEKEHEATLEQLKQKQLEVKSLQMEKDAAQDQHEESVQALKAKLMELERKYQIQEIKQKELNLDLALLQEQKQKHLVISSKGHNSEKRSLSQNSLDRLQNQKVIRVGPNMNQSSGRLLADGRLPALIDSGQVHVYIAKYNYDPFQFSPNENPEAELPLSSGDYVFINGEMDEDGFFEGELIDGKKGLVPSNFVEKVPDVDLVDFSSILVASGHHSDDNVLTSLAVQQEMDFNSSDESEQMSAILRLPDDKPLVLPNPDSVGDLGDIEEVEEDSSSLHLSMTDCPEYLTGDQQTESYFPRKLNLDRQLTNSLIISWLAPEIPRNTDIISYQIFVDGEFKSTIKGNERTKALLENIDSTKIHRVTVVCVTTRSRSAHQQCTLLAGKDALPTPTDLKVSHVTSNGASLSWWPGNSNYQHVISVNEQEVRVVNPGVYEYLLSGLAPATTHRVTIRAKSLLANFEEERNNDRKELLTSRIEFKTLVGGLPDPPLDVQVEVGPQEGTILLTWLPVTINRSGISHSGVIKGYSVYADDRLIKTVIGPISDHVLLNSANFSGFIPQRLTVRTLGDRDEESLDSQAVIIPPHLLKEMAASTAKNIAYEAIAARKHEVYEDKQEDCTNDTDDEIEAAFRECFDLDSGVTTKKAPSDTTDIGQGHDYNSSSELSDIAEVEEEPYAENTEAPLQSSGQNDTVEVPSSGKKVPPDRSPYQSPIRRPSSKGNDRNDLRISQHAMTIPQIEITRDSSTERANSFEDEETIEIRKVTKEDKSRVVSRKKSDIVSSDIYRTPNNNNNKVKEKVVDEFPGNPSEPWRTMVTPDWVFGSPASAKVRSQIVPVQPDPYYDNEEHLQHGVRVVEQNLMRLFVALFDYDPAVMSPNADGSDAELPFREGQVIKIFGECDSDGFYKGECNGKIGYVPCNMVTEVKVDDPDVVQQLLKESSSNSSGDSSSTPAKENFLSNSISSGLPVASDQLGPGKRMVALYDYDPQELSPNVDAEVELAFKMGDTIIIYGDMDDDGFFIGEFRGKQGLVPSNFIREANTPDDEIERTSVTQSQSRDSIPSPNIDEEVNRAISRNPEIRRTSSPQQVSGMGMKSLSECKLDNDGRPASAPHSDEDRKPKRKGGLSSAHSMTSMGAGLLSKGKNIFKKFTR